jgi:enoyl-CoA hydratase
LNFQHIDIQQSGAHAVMTIQREAALNALNRALLVELRAGVAALEADDGIRVVVLTGAGEKAFVAGADITEMLGMSPRQAQAFAELGFALGEAIEGSRKPYIAAVNGFALGGGCEVALACDFIYASSRARLGQPEVKLGVIPGFGGTQRLSRRVGVAKARELIYTGDMIGADEALRIGLVDAVVPPEELLPRVRELAERIAQNAPLAIAEAKRVIHWGQSMTLEQANLLELRAFAGLFDSQDQKEGMQAFVDKRKAAFHGR